MNNENEFLDWNGSFIAEETEFTLLKPGKYPFTVTDMERKIYDGNSDKIPNGAPYAEISMKVDGGEQGTTTVKERLYLMKKFTWKLTQFFESIGQAPVIGQPFNPNWNAVVGSKGTAEVEINTFMSNGEERQNNRVKNFIKPEANQFMNNQQAGQTQTTQSQQTQQNNNTGGFQPGAF